MDGVTNCLAVQETQSPRIASMTGRQRVMDILNRQAVDRPAFDLGGTDCSSVHVLAYARLRRHLGLPEKPIRCGCLSQLIAEPDADVQEKFGVDAEALWFGSRGDETMANALWRGVGGARAICRGRPGRRVFGGAKAEWGRLCTPCGRRLLFRSGRAAAGPSQVGGRAGTVRRAVRALGLLLRLRRAPRRRWPNGRGGNTRRPTARWLLCGECTTYRPAKSCAASSNSSST